VEPDAASPPPKRLVAVLGYSSRRDPELHAICRSRLEHAAREFREGDAVVLTGGRHRSLGRPEAEAMRDAWRGPATAVLLEDAARSTAENAAHVRAVAGELGVGEVVVVTSRWHSRRALALFRRAFRGTGIAVTAAPAPTAASPALLLREAACYAALPVQLRRAGRTSA
jgi:uncharacterized SAM-binding protein YcdF (DUF218 family)